MLITVIGESQFFAESEQFQNAISGIKLLDYASIGILASSFLASIIMASKIPTNPVFLPLSILFGAISVFVAYVLTLVIENMAGNSAAAQVFDEMFFTGIIGANLHIFVGVTVFAGIVATYGLSSSSGHGGGRRAPVR